MMRDMPAKLMDQTGAGGARGPGLSRVIAHEKEAGSATFAGAQARRVQVRAKLGRKEMGHV
jgi:hypothetical protein